MKKWIFCLLLFTAAGLLQAQVAAAKKITIDGKLEEPEWAYWR